MGDHDTLFKRAFSVPAHAAGELRSTLPSTLADKLDLGALELVPGSFVDAEMGHRHTDLLFRARIAGRPALVYLLFEHRSEPDRLMPFRVLRYLVRILGAVLRGEPRRTTVPPVITVIVHHGEGGWSAARRFHEIVDGLAEVPELARFVPDFELLVDDLAHEDDQALRERPLPAFPKVALFLLRDARDVEVLLEHLHVWAAELEAMASEADPDRQDIVFVLRYILRVAGEVPFEVVRRRIAAVAPAVEEYMASSEEQLIEKGRMQGREQGREQGLAQGREQGLAQGREQALRDTLTRLLRARFGPLGSEVERRIAEAPAGDLDRLIERVVTTATLHDVFAP